MDNVGTSDASSFALYRVPKAAAYLLELATVSVSYLGLAAAGLMLPSLNPVATPLWPPTGLALAVFLLRGYRIWPAILFGTVAPQAMAARALLPSGLIGIGALLAVLVGAWLINRWSNGSKTFDTPVGVARFTLISFVPVAVISSTAGVTGLTLANEVSFADHVPWATWWFADATAIVVIAPVIVLVGVTPLRPFSQWRLLETVALLILAAAAGIVAYTPLLGLRLSELAPYQSPLKFLVLLPLMWAILRGNQRNAALAAFIFCATALWGFFLGSDSFLKTDLNGSLLRLAISSISISLPALILSAAIASRRDREAQLLGTVDESNRQILRTNLELETLRRHFQIVIEGVVDHAFFALDGEGHVATWNGGAQHLIGHTADEIVGKHFGIFYRPDERGAGEPDRALKLAVQKGKHEVEGWRIGKNGKLLFVTATLTSMRDNNGNLVGFAAIFRDATERRDTQEKLVEAREQLAMAQKMEAIGKLTGGIAHDFNNLLMIIGGNAQIFKRLLDPKLPRAIEAIQTAAKRGESLTRQLLTFAARRQHLSPTVVDLNACVRNMRTLIESSLRGNIVYNEKIDPTVRPVKVDLAELELAIVNVAVNARDAMPNGGTFSLAIRNATNQGDGVDGEFVAIEFSDTGAGIAADVLAKIFDPFFTTKDVGKGTGLGLSQVYGFAHQAGGFVKADSTIGEGTTVTIHLPALPEGEVVGPDVVAIDAPRSRRPMVLIVDDSAEVAEVTSSLLEHLGFDTVYRESAEAALKLLADGTNIDLVLSDIVMPGTLDGRALASEIRSQYPNLPVILSTGYGEAARTAPADFRVLPKPFDIDALRSVVQEAMQANLADS